MCEVSGSAGKYHALLDKALETSGTNQPELAKALESATPEMKEGVAFLISYMPERDLKTMKGDDLLSNVKLAYEARNRFAWAKSVPDSIFLNDVLPYASLNEERDQWRADFYKRFAPYVENCKTLEEAIKAVNKNIRDEVKVDYNTAREKPDQNPSESIRQGMASCSGLSILLTDALRSVGIPSRIAGTANWHDNRGNHNWCEVWLDGNGISPSITRTNSIVLGSLPMPEKLIQRIGCTLSGPLLSNRRGRVFRWFGILILSTCLLSMSLNGIWIFIKRFINLNWLGEIMYL